MDIHDFEKLSLIGPGGNDLWKEKRQIWPGPLAHTLFTLFLEPGQTCRPLNP